jgi:predicted nucleic acid-binding protein
MPMSDIVIATLAVDHGSSVLTVDRHFADIPGIKMLE